MATVEIKIDLDLNTLGDWSDEYLAAVFTAVQLWSLPSGDGWAEYVVGKLRWEIIRRWVRDYAESVDIYRFQETHSFVQDMGRLGAKYEPGGPSDTPDWHRGAWVIPVPTPAPVGDAAPDQPGQPSLRLLP